MECPRCHQMLEGQEEDDAIQDWGCCLGCDHIEGQVAADQEREFELEMED